MSHARRSSRRASRTQKLRGAQRERRRPRGHPRSGPTAARARSSTRQGGVPARAKRCAIHVHLRVDTGGPVGVAPRSGSRATEGTSALGSVAAIRVARHPSGSLGRAVIAWQPGGRGWPDDEWGARGSERRPLHRCVQAGYRIARPVRAAPQRRRPWLRPGTRAAHGGKALAVEPAANREPSRCV
jgi:hypothetical protein